MADKKLNIIRNNKKEAAIVFVHGFLGDADKTWGKFPQLIQNDFLLSNWDLYTLGYSSKLSPDLRGVWSGDAPIEMLANLLKTESEILPLNNYSEINIVAHSMGGLIVQRACVLSNTFNGKLKNLIMFGTPSNGLKKVIPVCWFKRQLADMHEKSKFITELREQWVKKITERPIFHLSVCAGDRDEFVPATSSLKPFPQQFQKVVNGNHLEIVKPEKIDSLSYRVVQGSILGDIYKNTPYNLISVFSELSQFEEVIKKYEGKESKLDESSLVSYALSLEGLGYRDRAVAILEKHNRDRTDALGTLAGRFKRMWINEGIENYAERAYELYSTAFKIAQNNNDHKQMYYHKINIAFLELVFVKNHEKAKKFALDVKNICENLELGLWESATIGEANLHLNPEEALRSYQKVVDKKIKPWQVLSMFRQAAIICEEYKLDHIENELYELFTGIK